MLGEIVQPSAPMKKTTARSMMLWRRPYLSESLPPTDGETAPKRIRGTLVAVDQMMIVFGQFLAFSMNAVLARMHGGPEVTLANDVVNKSGEVVAKAGDKVAWETVQHFSNVVVESGNGMTWRYMLVLATLPAVALWFGISISSTSSAMEPSLDSSRTRLREPMASAMRRLATYQREDSGMRRMPNHRATAGRVAPSPKRSTRCWRSSARRPTRRSGAWRRSWASNGPATCSSSASSWAWPTR